MCFVKEDAVKMIRIVIKRIAMILFVFALLFESIEVHAVAYDEKILQEKEYIANNSISNSHGLINKEMMYEIVNEIEEKNILRLDETRILNNADGESLYVEIYSVDLPRKYTMYNAKGVTTNTKEYKFYRRGLFNTKIHMFDVLSVCTWNPGAQINDFYCVYHDQATGVLCQWNSNCSSSTPSMCIRTLQAYYSTNEYVIFFSANLSVDLYSITLSCSEDDGVL